MKGSLDISVSSPLWRGLPRARAIARETIAAAVAESGGAVRIDRPEGRASLQTPHSGDVSLSLADDAVVGVGRDGMCDIHVPNPVARQRATSERATDSK